MDQSYVCALIAMMVRALARTSRGLGLPTGSHGIPGEDGGLVPCRQKWVGLWPACWATSRPGQPPAAWLCVHVCAVGVWVGQQGGFAFLLAWGACVQPCPARPTGVEHHLPQLADLRAAHLVLHSVDDPQPEEVCYDQLPLHGCLWKPAAHTAVHMEL